MTTSRPRAEDPLSQLVRAIAQQQDRDAFAQLFGRLAPRIKGWLCRKGATPIEAEELAQEVMLIVWQKAARFDPSRASVSTWVFTIARNRFVDRVRKQSRPKVTAEDIADQLGLRPQAPDQAVDTARREQRVRLALASLPQAQVAVIEATYFDGLSQREYAAASGIAVGTVKSRVRLAMGHLLSALEQPDPDQPVPDQPVTDSEEEVS